MGKEALHNKGVYLTLCLRQLGISQIQSHYNLEHSNGRCPGCDYHIGVEIHVDCLTGFEQSHLHVEFHQKVIESWVGVESEHIA